MKVIEVTVPEHATSLQLRNLVQSVGVRAGYSYTDAGRALDISPTTVWNLINGTQKDSPTLRKRWAIRKTDRIRLAADLDSEEQREALKAHAAEWDMSWSEFCQGMADDLIRLYGDK